MANQTNESYSSPKVRESIENKEQKEAWEFDLLNYREGFIRGILAVRNAMVKVCRQTKFDGVYAVEEANIKWIDDILDNDEKIDDLMGH